MKVVVDVTADDIKAGASNDCTGCPIALALARACKASPWADRRQIFAKGVGVASTPLIARRFMDAFDAGADVEPFTFTLELA